MPYKVWNWMLKDWPNFSYDEMALEALEYQFSEKSGTVLGVVQIVIQQSKQQKFMSFKKIFLLFFLLIIKKPSLH
jgi:hypothetical protein